MKTNNLNSEMVAFFKALGDANRLKIVGLLAQENYSVEELAEILGLRASTVSHHLSRLSEVGIVSAKAESYYNVYQLEAKVLEDLARRMLSEEALPQAAAGIDMDAYDRKVVENYTFPEGRLKTIPSQRKKREAILRHILKAFDPDVVYTEKQVNEILKQFHEDTATLRRELIGYRMMSRKAGGSAYWVRQTDDSDEAAS